MDATQKELEEEREVIGSYGIPKDLVYSFPVTCSNGDYSIVQGLEIDEFSRFSKKYPMDATLRILLWLCTNWKKKERSSYTSR